MARRRGSAGRPRSRRRGRRLWWEELSDEELLDVRLCDLVLRIEVPPLEERIQRLYDELERRGLGFRPHLWLSSEWFSPSGVPGIAVPFYLAHPRLKRLEQRQMLDVEGGTEEWCMQLLRHETGHAIDTAYRLHFKKSWRETFGPFSEPYTDFYQPKPYSRSYVLHLDNWYAQSHPAEDFAETFAVWLRPGSQWRKRYQGWPALRKLEYVDALMAQIAGKRPLVVSRERTEHLGTLRASLREHYKRKRLRYGDEYPEFYDRDLRRVFREVVPGERRPSAAAFLRRIRPEIRREVARWTGEFQYTIDQVLQDMIERCRELRLVVDSDEPRAKLDSAILLTVQTMNHLHGGRHRLAR